MLFKKIEEKKWVEKYKKKAEEYDKKELDHASSRENPLTEDELHKIAKS